MRLDRSCCELQPEMQRLQLAGLVSLALTLLGGPTLILVLVLIAIHSG